MSTAIHRLVLFLLCNLFYIAGCSADLPQAPTNQLIKGSFTITTEWQTIKFKKPLKTLPHIQRLELLLSMDKYEPVDDIGQSEYDIIGDSYLSIANNIPIRLEVIFIDSKGYEYEATKKAVGFGKTKEGAYHFLAYGTNPNKDKFYFAENIEFTAVKIKANTKFNLEHLFWHTPYYYKAPHDTWDDINQSEIVILK